MEFGHQLVEDYDGDAFSRLELRIEFLASKLKAAVQDNPTGGINLRPTLEECATLKRELAVYKARYYSRHTILGELVDTIYNLGLCFGNLQHLTKPHQLAWDIRLKFSWGHLLARDLDIKDYYRRESAEMSHVRFLLGSLVYNLTYWAPSVDLEMIWTNNSSMESYHVLSVDTDWTGVLWNADAVEKPGGAIYVRQIFSFPGRLLFSPRPIYIMYQQDSSSATPTSAILPETTEESTAVGLQITQHEERLEDFLHTALGSSTSGYSVALMLTGRFAENEVPSLHPLMQDQPPHTATDSSARQLPLTSQHEAVVVEPTEALQSSNTTIDMYGFAQTPSPYAPMNTIAQELLSRENRGWAAPASLTSPEVDTPWSETQGPPPPDALSPGIYQLRLEAATRPSPVASSPDLETPAPPYALSPGVFRRYGDDF